MQHSKTAKTTGKKCKKDKGSRENIKRNNQTAAIF